MPSLSSEIMISPEPTVTCVTTGPIFKKMKVLKKFKKKMGLASRSSELSPSPPLTFNQVCGNNIRIDPNGRVARRVESFCKGIAFSARPIRVGERVYIRLLEISRNWSGVIRFGLTSQDPSGLKDALPKYACPDLTNKPGYWAKALSERFSEQGLIIFYYVTSTGDVHFGVNGEEKGIFFSGVETRCPLWSLIDVYGNCTAVEYLDPLAQLNNKVIVNDLRPGSTVADSRILPLSHNNQQTSIQENDVDRLLDRLQPSMAQIDLSHTPSFPALSQALIHYSTSSLRPFSFHSVKGRNIALNNDQTLATRLRGEYSHGYVFTARPLNCGEQFVIQVTQNEAAYVGALAFGLTSANPAGLDSSDLPEDCDLLLDRPEYWVVSKDVASSPVLSDELAFGLTQHGEVTFSKNGGPSQVVMHVDNSLKLWAFFDVYGNTREIKCFGSSQNSAIRSEVVRHVQDRSSNVQSRSTVVTHPPSPPKVTIIRQSPRKENVTYQSADVYLQSVIHSRNTTVSSVDYRESPTVSSPTASPGSVARSPNECTVCYEKAVDSVLYSCGHMCMCYSCAIRQWKARGGGHCPICRALIKDVIRTYKS